MDKAREQLLTGDWQSAKATLEVVKQKNPNQEFLWGMLGAVAEMHRDFDEAKADYRKEMKKQPDNPMVAGALASVEKRSGDAVAAQQSLKEYLALHPEELRLSLLLAQMQLVTEDNNGALKTLRTAADQHPDDSNVRLQLGETLLRLQRNDEAVAVAKSVLEDATDPDLMNDAVYILSETGHDLEYAEAMSRKSVGMLEEKGAAITAAEANSKAFANADMLVAAWDTLGWILYRRASWKTRNPWSRQRGMTAFELKWAITWASSTRQ